MKKIIRLTENDLNKLIKKVIKEADKISIGHLGVNNRYQPIANSYLKRLNLKLKIREVNGDVYYLLVDDANKTIVKIKQEGGHMSIDEGLSNTIQVLLNCTKSAANELVYRWAIHNF